MGSGGSSGGRRDEAKHRRKEKRTKEKMETNRLLHLKSNEQILKQLGRILREGRKMYGKQVTSLTMVRKEFLFFLCSCLLLLLLFVVHFDLHVWLDSGLTVFFLPPTFSFFFLPTFFFHSCFILLIETTVVLSHSNNWRYVFFNLLFLACTIKYVYTVNLTYINIFIVLFFFLFLF